MEKNHYRDKSFNIFLSHGRHTERKGKGECWARGFCWNHSVCNDVITCFTVCKFSSRAVFAYLFVASSRCCCSSVNLISFQCVCFTDDALFCCVLNEEKAKFLRPVLFFPSSYAFALPPEKKAQKQTRKKASFMFCSKGKKAQKKLLNMAREGK